MEIRQMTFIPKAPVLKKVCAYARISSGKDAMLHSLAAQVDYYSSTIRHTPGWEYAGVYSDEAKTGTKDSRPGFQNMIDDCRAGKIDLIITKSISRFARNTLTLLDVARELKSLNCDIYFEEQNIHTLSEEGELMLTLLASFAQEESRSVSDNMKWRIRNNFKNGIPWDKTLLGYRFEDGRYVIYPEEAETVRFIFSSYLSGKGIGAIANELNSEQICTRFGGRWYGKTVMWVLKNYTYTGNLLLQKTYCESHLSKKMKDNNGELPKYHVTDSHEAIIDIESFNAVQELIQKRNEQFSDNSSRKTHPLSGKITCGICGKNYRRKKRREKYFWICTTYNAKGKSACPSKQVPEKVIESLVALYYGDFDHITVNPGNELIFVLNDGSSHIHHWEDESRKNSWTDEMKIKAAEDGKRRKNKGESNATD